MKDFETIFSEEVEVPDIVMQKMDTAFAEIQSEGKIMAKTTRRKYKISAAAVACATVIVAGGITGIAAIHHVWSRGIEGTLQATDEQKQALVDNGVATVISEKEDYRTLAVTDNGVTVTPEMVIVDENYALISFSVSGYAIGEYDEPAFEYVDTYIGNDPNSEESWVNMSASFYDGIISDENGAPVYDNGKALEYAENGGIISHYVDEDGNLEYVMQIATPNYEKDSLLGKKLHVSLQNLGTVSKTIVTTEKDGKWDFDIALSNVSAACNIEVNKELEGTAFTLEDIWVSPISITMNYAVTGEVEMYEDENGIPMFCGVVLKDGTRLKFLADGSTSGYEDDTMSKAYNMNVFCRVIDVESIESLLVQVSGEEELTEIKLNK